MAEFKASLGSFAEILFFVATLVIAFCSTRIRSKKPLLISMLFQIAGLYLARFVLLPIIGSIGDVVYECKIIAYAIPILFAPFSILSYLFGTMLRKK